MVVRLGNKMVERDGFSNPIDLNLSLGRGGRDGISVQSDF